MVLFKNLVLLTMLLVNTSSRLVLIRMKAYANLFSLIRKSLLKFT